MDKQDLLALYDRHQRIEIEIPGVRKEVFPQLVRFTRPVPGMNYVSYSRLDGATQDAVIQEQVAHFSRFDQPFSWHVCEHDTPPDLRERLVANGFEPDDDPDAVMVLDVQAASPALREPVTADVRRLTQRDQLDDIIRIEEQVLGGNFAWIKQRLGDHLAIPGYLSVYVAYVDSQPACSGWTYFHPGSRFAGLFGAATVPMYRKRGLYTAVLAVRVQEAVQRGYPFLTTGASPMSRPILTQNGFEFLTYGYAYEWKRPTKEETK